MSDSDEFREVDDVLNDNKPKNVPAAQQGRNQSGHKTHARGHNTKKDNKKGGGIMGSIKLKNFKSKKGEKKMDQFDSESKAGGNVDPTGRYRTVYDVVADDVDDEDDVVKNIRSSLVYDGVEHKFGKIVLGAFFLFATLAAIVLSKLGLLFYANRAWQDLGQFVPAGSTVALGSCSYGPLEITPDNGSHNSPGGRLLVVDNVGCMTDQLWFALTIIPLAPLFLQFCMGCTLAAVREKFDIDDDPTVIHWQGRPAIMKRKAIILITLIESVFESAAIVLFMLFVVPFIDAISVLALLCSVAVGPALSAFFWNFWHERSTSVSVGDPAFIMIIRAVVTLAQIASVVLVTIYNTAVADNRPSHLIWAIPLSVIVYSLTWWRAADRHLPKALRRALDKYHYSSVWQKAVFKFILIGGFSYIAAFVYFELDSEFLGSNSVVNRMWETDDANTWNLLPAIGAAFFGFVAWLVTSEGLRAALARAGFGAPVALATPVTTVIVMLQWCGNSDNFGFSNESNAWPVITSMSDANIPTCSFSDLLLPLVALVMSYLSWLVVSGLHIKIDHRNVNQIDKDLWIRAGFDAVFLDAAFAMNRNMAPQATVAGSARPGDHFTFIVATLYRESEIEMRNIMTSIRNMNARLSKTERNRFRMLIMFDGALGESKDRAKQDYYPSGLNDFAIQFLDVMEEFSNGNGRELMKFYVRDDIESQCVDFTFKHQIRGAREEENNLLVTCVFKNTNVVKQRKRWSQILYVSMIIEEILSSRRLLNRIDRNIYLLLLDGDTQFDKEAVDMMREVMERDPQRTGGVCGRIYPEGPDGPMSPIVMYQKFEYAVGHWMQKTAEHVFGTVMCSPGCFSMVRFAALIRKSGEGDFTKVGESAIEKYSIDAETSMDVLMYDQGEDRMLTTLLIKNGWMLQYAAAAKAVTFCPESFSDFFVQRRRWISSTLANLMQLMAWGPEIIKNNRSFSVLFFVYCALILGSSILGPATVVMITQGGLSFAFNWPTEVGVIVGLGIPLFYVFICYVFWFDVVTPDTGQTKQKKIDIQIRVAMALTGIYALWMCAVAVGVTVNIVVDIAENGVPKSPDTYFLGSLAMVFILTALMHNETWSLLHGFLYLTLLPTMYLILIIFAIANTHDQSWGTREPIGTDSKKQEIANLAWIDWIPACFRWCWKRYYKVESDDNQQGNLEADSTGRTPGTQDVLLASEGSLATSDVDAADANSGSADQPRALKKKSPSRVGFALDPKDGSDSDSDEAPLTSALAQRVMNANLKRQAQYRAFAESKRSRRQMWIDDRAKDEKRLGEVDATRGLSMAITASATTGQQTANAQSAALAQAYMAPSDRGKTVVWADDKTGIELEDRFDDNAADRQTRQLIETKKDRLRELATRLRATLVPQPLPAEEKVRRAEEMASLARVVSLIFLLISLAWLTLAFAVGLHSELSALDSNFLGLVFLIAFGALILFQFFATIYHRWETLLHLVSMVPMGGGDTCECIRPATGDYVEIEQPADDASYFDALTGKNRNKSIAFVGQSLYVPPARSARK